MPTASDEGTMAIAGKLTTEPASQTLGPRSEGRTTPAPRLGAIRAARVAADVLAIGSVVALSFLLRFRWHVAEWTPAPFDVAGHVAVTVLWFTAVLAAMGIDRLYDEDTLGSSGEIGRVGRAIVVGVAAVSTVVFLLRLVSVSRGWFLLVAVGSFAALALDRRGFAWGLGRLRAQGRLRRPAILVTDADPNEEASFGEFDVILRVHPRVLPSVVRELGEPEGRGTRPALIVDGSAVHEEDLWRLVLHAGEARVPVYVRSPVRSVSADRLTVRELDGRTIVKVAPPALSGFRAVEKRSFDVIVSASMLVLLALPMLAIAVTVLVSSGRPVFYGQQRVGLGGRLFTMWKFRTMPTDAETASGPVWATKGDPRCTPLGRVLRRLSLDELPQLWNVLRGDMSVVGPRPERPLFVAEFSERFRWYRYRDRTRPGMTGLAQVRGLRGDSPLEPRLESDNRYIEHWTLSLDLRIMLRTVVEAVRGRGAV
jgi:lipopolysaccharide/colanic/teichoic acid biosynthesis glycosyltransferase